MEKEKIRLSLRVAEGSGHAIVALQTVCKEITEEKELVSSYAGGIAALEAQIAALQLTAEQIAERRKKQHELARLAVEAVESAASIDAAIAVLKRRLELRQELEGHAMKLLDEIDFTFNGCHDFDCDRFEALARQLPGPLQPESQKWCDWFLGRGERRSTLIVHERCEIAETLASPGLFVRGDAPLLNASECAAVESKPPRGLTTQEFEMLHYASGGPPAAQSDLHSGAVAGIIRG